MLEYQLEWYTKDCILNRNLCNVGLSLPIRISSAFVCSGRCLILNVHFYCTLFYSNWHYLIKLMKFTNIDKYTETRIKNKFEIYNNHHHSHYFGSWPGSVSKIYFSLLFCFINSCFIIFLNYNFSLNNLLNLLRVFACHGSIYLQVIVNTCFIHFNFLRLLVFF